MNRLIAAENSQSQKEEKKKQTKEDTKRVYKGRVQKVNKIKINSRASKSNFSVKISDPTIDVPILNKFIEICLKILSFQSFANTNNKTNGHYVLG